MLQILLAFYTYLSSEYIIILIIQRSFSSNFWKETRIFHDPEHPNFFIPNDYKYVIICTSQ